LENASVFRDFYARLRNQTLFENKKAGANAGPLQLPCKIDQ